MAAKSLLPLIILLSLLSLPSSHGSITTAVLLRAADLLLNAGHLSMSLTLQLVSKTLLTTTTTPHSSSSHSLTIFSPSDSAFASSGQPSLSLLRFHFSPHSLPLHSLKSFPFNSRIPTLFPHHSLIVTSSPSIDCNVSISGVKITHKPIYDDGSLVIFGIEEFLNPRYRVLGSFRNPDRNLGCGVWGFNEMIMSTFKEANEVMRSKGHSFMASLLELQLLGFNKSGGVDELTVFAPVDRAMMDYVGNVSDYPSLFLRHIVPCKILWSDLVGFKDHGVVALRTFLDGFKINVTGSDDDEDDAFMINGVGVSSPDLYYSDWLVVHGISDVLGLPERAKNGAEHSSEIGSDSHQEIAPRSGEF